jgi:hypothetical protein
MSGGAMPTDPDLNLQRIKQLLYVITPGKFPWFFYRQDVNITSINVEVIRESPLHLGLNRIIYGSPNQVNRAN